MVPFLKVISRSPMHRGNVRNSVSSLPSPKGEEKARGLEAWQTTRQTQDETLMTATEDEKLAAALDLLKRLPPSRVYTYLEVSSIALALHPPPPAAT